MWLPLAATHHTIPSSVTNLTPLYTKVEPPFSIASSHGNQSTVSRAVALMSWAWYLFSYARWDQMMLAQMRYGRASHAGGG